MFMGIDQRLAAIYVAFYFIICSGLFADDLYCSDCFIKFVNMFEYVKSVVCFELKIIKNAIILTPRYLHLNSH